MSANGSPGTPPRDGTPSPGGRDPRGPVTETVQVAAAGPVPAAPAAGGRTGYVWSIAVIACLGAFLFGYNTAVVNGSLDFISDPSQLSLDAMGQGLVSSGLTLGAAFGAVFGGPLSDRLGRRRILLWLGVLFTVGAVLCAVAPSVAVLVAARFVLGLVVGAASANVPLYLAEISPTAMRGQLVSLNQLMIVGGQFVSFGVNAWLGTAFGDEAWIWRVMLGVASLPGIALWIGAMVIPETPRWLAAHGRLREAHEALKRIRSEQEADRELAEIRRGVAATGSEKKAGWREFARPWILQITLTGALLGVFQQFAGINSIMYYGTQILRTSGFGEQAALISNVANGLFSCIGAVVGMYTVDRLGRKRLLYAGFVVCGLALVAVGLISTFAHGQSWSGVAVMGLVLLFILVFQGTLGPVTWLVNSEIFPAEYRGLGTGITIFVLWMGNFLVGLLFPVMLETLGLAGSFYLFAAACAIGVVFVRLRVPETKGVPLEEVVLFFRRRYDTEYTDR